MYPKEISNSTTEEPVEKIPSYRNFNSDTNMFYLFVHGLHHKPTV